MPQLQRHVFLRRDLRQRADYFANQELDTRALAATCANCHGTDGHAVAGSGSARLAGQSSAFIVEQMQAFRSGVRPATVMHQLAKGFSDAQIRDLAAYFAAQR
ncbi:c-type cytochrome [Comamonadaceae bacterium G21597-S1]|nr:c-type cytochrome [Comamonadaceae bacterium G21597-S1]